MRLAGRGIGHEFGVAVIGGDQRDAAASSSASITMPSAASDASTAVTVASMYAGMADHVGIGEVDHDDVEALPLAISCAARSAIAFALHLGLEVVGRDFRRRDQHALFERNGCSTPPLRK